MIVPKDKDVVLEELETETGKSFWVFVNHKRLLNPICFNVSEGWCDASIVNPTKNFNENKVQAVFADEILSTKRYYGTIDIAVWS